MAMNWTTSPGGLFNRIGAWCKLIKDVRTFQNTTTLTTREPVITDLYHTPATPVRHLKYLTGNPPVLFAAAKAQMDPITAMALAQIRKTVMEQVHAEDPLEVKDDDHALAKLIELMVLDAQTVERQPIVLDIVYGTANASNIGNAKIAFAITGTQALLPAFYLSIIRNRDYIRAETLEIETVSEASGSGAVSVAGELVQPLGSYLWPGGSGAGPTVPIVDLSVDGSGEVYQPGNQVLTNGDMESFTSNLPTGWVADSGVAGTDFGQTTTAGQFYAGSSGLRFIGTADSIAPRVKQYFAATDSPGYPKDRSYYMCGFWIKGSSAAVGTGQFSVTTEILGTSVVGSAVSIDMSAGFPTSWTFYAFLITNDALSIDSTTDAIFVGVSDGGDLTNGQFVYVDSIAVVPCQYHAGHLIAAFPGSIDTRIGDKWTRAIANDRTAEFQFYLDMAYDLLKRGVGIPSTGFGGETVLDSLIA